MCILFMNTKISNITKSNNTFILRYANSVGTIDGVSTRLVYNATPHTSKHPLNILQIVSYN